MLGNKHVDHSTSVSVGLQTCGYRKHSKRLAQQIHHQLFLIDCRTEHVEGNGQEEEEVKKSSSEDLYLLMFKVCKIGQYETFIELMKTRPTQMHAESKRRKYIWLCRAIHYEHRRLITLLHKHFSYEPTHWRYQRTLGSLAERGEINLILFLHSLFPMSLKEDKDDDDETFSLPIAHVRPMPNHSFFHAMAANQVKVVDLFLEHTLDQDRKMLHSSTDLIIHNLLILDYEEMFLILWNALKWTKAKHLLPHLGVYFHWMCTHRQTHMLRIFHMVCRITYKDIIALYTVEFKKRCPLPSDFRMYMYSFMGFQDHDYCMS